MASVGRLFSTIITAWDSRSSLSCTTTCSRSSALSHGPSPEAAVQLYPLMMLQGIRAEPLARMPTLHHLCSEPAPTLLGQGQGWPGVTSWPGGGLGLVPPTGQPSLGHGEQSPGRRGKLTSPTQPSFCMYLRTMDQIWHLVSSWPPVTASKCS